MKKLINNLIIFSSILSALVLLVGCNNCSSKKSKNQNNMLPQTMETFVFYEVYEDDKPLNGVQAKMYTHGNKGDEVSMGNIQFMNADNGVKMRVKLKDLRPGKVYTANLYKCEDCDAGSCCEKADINVSLPNLSINKSGVLEKTFEIKGLNSAQLNNMRLYLERDGGYKAAWGMLKPYK